MAVIFEDRIRALRQQRKMTQEELAERLGVARPMISAYENGTHQPSHETLLKIASVFGVSMDHLYGVEKNRADKMYLEVTGLSPAEVAVLADLVSIIKGEKKPKADAAPQQADPAADASIPP